MVRVIVSGSRIPAKPRARIRAVVGQIGDATAGHVRATFELTDDTLPEAHEGEAAMTLVTDARDHGCIHVINDGTHIVRGQSYLDATNAPQAHAHELGHGILGMCHIDGALIGGARNSLTSGGPGIFNGDIALQLSDRDMEAARAVYSSGLEIGATRADFAQVGLVRRDGFGPSSIRRQQTFGSDRRIVNEPRTTPR